MHLFILKENQIYLSLCGHTQPALPSLTNQYATHLIQLGPGPLADQSSWAQGHPGRPSGLSLMDGMALIFDQVDPWAPPVQTFLGV